MPPAMIEGKTEEEGIPEQRELVFTGHEMNGVAQMSREKNNQHKEQKATWVRSPKRSNGRET